jgi:hypothetical protein
MSTVAFKVVTVLFEVSHYEDALRNGGTIPWIFKLDIRWRLNVEL